MTRSQGKESIHSENLSKGMNGSEKFSFFFCANFQPVFSIIFLILKIVGSPPKDSAISRGSIVMVNGSIWTGQINDGIEIESLRRELIKSKQTIFEMKEKENKLKERLAEQAQRLIERGVRFENVCLGERRPTALIRRYGNLYAQARVDTLDSLDSLPQLKDADELKSKLLFSVVVVSFIHKWNIETVI